MKIILHILLIMLLGVATVCGQDGRRPLEQIHNAKIKYIKKNLHLTGAQAKDFFPVYNEYEGELRTMRQTFLLAHGGRKSAYADDSSARQFIDDDLDYQQQVIALKRRYNDRFLKVLTAQQVADLYKTEREFKQLLVQRLRMRRMSR